VLSAAKVQISMDGKGRCIDNVFVESLWRSLKYEDVYLCAYTTGTETSAWEISHIGISRDSDDAMTRRRELFAQGPADTLAGPGDEKAAADHRPVLRLIQASANAPARRIDGSMSPGSGRRV
jgi:transposase InsO family protein